LTALPYSGNGMLDKFGARRVGERRNEGRHVCKPGAICRDRFGCIDPGVHDHIPDLDIVEASHLGAPGESGGRV
jgi:hypothetical protein